MERKIRTGVFGSAFNPPTKGHENAIIQAMDLVDEIFLLPSYSHAYGKKMIDFDDRCSLLELFKENFKDKAKIKIVKDEKDYFKESNVDSVYTYDILNYLSKKYPEREFYFICGEDNGNPESWSKFYKNELIDRDFNKIVVKETLKIRSTFVRENIKKGMSVKQFLHANVEKCLTNNNWY